MLSKFNDYSGIPYLIDFLNDPQSRYSVAHSLMKIGYKNKKVVLALINALEDESKQKELNDERISAIIQVLNQFTGQSYSYRSYDPLEVRKKNISKWFDWWEANKDKFK
jgi:HEAT repeat protein